MNSSIHRIPGLAEIKWFTILESFPGGMAVKGFSRIRLKPVE
jgi:hypothetical protein